MFGQSLGVEIFRYEKGWFLRWDGKPNQIIDGGEYCVEGFFTFDHAVKKARQLFRVKDEDNEGNNDGERVPKG